MVMVVVDEDKEENKEENKKRKKKKRKKRKKKREKTARSLCSTTTTVSSSVSFLYTRVTVLLLSLSCFVLFCFFFRQTDCQRQTKKNKKNSSVFLSLSDCVCLEDSFQFNNDTHFFGTKIKVLLLGEMEVMEARTKGSGWEITSTLNAQEKKKKKKKNDEELKIACAEKEEEEEEEVIFKNALQSFSLISALRYPPTRDGVHQRTGESAKGAVSRSSKKPKRSGNEENELDGAALTEIRSNSSRKKRKQRDERKTKSLERKLSENQQHDDAQPQEEFEEEEEEKKKKEKKKKKKIDDSKTTASQPPLKSAASSRCTATRQTCACSKRIRTKTWRKKRGTEEERYRLLRRKFRTQTCEKRQFRERFK